MTSVGNQPVYAYQIRLDNEGKPSECWHLSDTDGDYSAGCGHNRQVDIRFVCDNDQGAYGIPGESKSEVDYTLTTGAETEVCHYRMEFHTVYGCPSQCLIVGNKLCNGVGLCGYDWSIQQPRCYCYSLWSGDSCTIINMQNLFHRSKR